ncbi:methylated-DNA--[protein]-cysteine S-methyltransferase [Streptomyces sp. NBC_01190]|uniref:methylated-DNA--[protein]-cysteine S-methyltransferase n=1 Tax=Streptomyces sp. NBC_01190 TaxID=2903767 RepID=UPI00386A3B85|nr:methylated-DNA--[protein]-cysteine S-methyltransferase [Streptomyces sp. NBC_01190]
MTTPVHTQVDSPCGPLTLVASGDGIAGLYMTDHRHRPAPESFGAYVEADEISVLADVSEQLAAYFAGDLTRFEIPMTVAGTPFQQRVWSALNDIPYGRTVSYGELAAALGQPGSSRAVGLANGKNPISIIVPCHRVIGANGSLTGYGGGLDRKRWLLDFERGGTQPTLM